MVNDSHKISCRDFPPVGYQGVINNAISYCYTLSEKRLEVNYNFKVTFSLSKISIKNEVRVKPLRKWVRNIYHLLDIFKRCRIYHFRNIFFYIYSLTFLKYIISQVTVMLVTSLCWWLYDVDWFQMLVAESLCWRLLVMLVIFSM